MSAPPRATHVDGGSEGGVGAGVSAVADVAMADTQLRMACHDGYLQGAKEAVALGARPSTRDSSGKTPFWRACAGGHLEVAKWLLQSAAVDLHLAVLATPLGESPFLAACKRGHLEVVQWMYESVEVARADALRVSLMRVSPFMAACEGGHLMLAQWLYQSVKELQGEHVTAVDSRGFTALHAACYEGKAAVVQWLCEEVPELAECGAITTCDAEGNQPAVLALRLRVERAGFVNYEATVDIVRTLYKHAAHVVGGRSRMAAPDHRGETLCFKACSLGLLQVVQWICTGNAKELRSTVATPDAGGRSPFVAAYKSWHSHVADCLLTHAPEACSRAAVGSCEFNPTMWERLQANWSARESVLVWLIRVRGQARLYDSVTGRPRKSAVDADTSDSGATCSASRARISSRTARLRLHVLARVPLPAVHCVEGLLLIV